jgi:hypothetical protein
METREQMVWVGWMGVVRSVLRVVKSASLMGVGWLGRVTIFGG